MKSIVVELPDYDSTSGGINRMLRIVVELPHYSKTSGGVKDTLTVAEMFNPQMIVRFQNLNNGYPNVHNLSWSVGLPDSTFPECDICITYSDNPYTQRLLMLPQVKKVFILMLSYGMNLPVEKRNVLFSNINVLCSSKKIEKAILADGGKVNRIGIGVDMSDMYLTNIPRKRHMAILYHDMITKRYLLAVEIADTLYRQKHIDGVITFGRSNGYDKAHKPIGLVKHYTNATRDEVREIFNTCSLFFMPSSTEGINLTPIESTLCGCPAVLCDGAIDEVFFNEKNCLVARNKKQMIECCIDILKNDYSEKFRLDMLDTIKDMTWERIINNLKKAIC